MLFMTQARSTCRTVKRWQCCFSNGGTLSPADLEIKITSLQLQADEEEAAQTGHISWRQTSQHYMLLPDPPAAEGAVYAQHAIAAPKSCQLIAIGNVQHTCYPFTPSAPCWPCCT
jgi:hypothetical protein